LSFAGVEIYMLNGNQITGTEFSFTGGKSCQLSYFGTKITLPWTQIKRIQLNSKYFVELEDGNKVVGKTILDKQQKELPFFMAVAIDDKQNILVQKDKIVSVKSEQRVQKELAELEKEASKGLARYWSGNVDMGYQAFSGNTDENLANYRLLGIRESAHDKIALELSGMKGKKESIETQNQNKVGMRFDLKHRPNRTYFMLSTLEYDKIKKIDQRTVLGAGAGFTFVDRPGRLFKMSFGATTDRELRMDNTKKELTTGLIAAEFKMPTFFNSSFETIVNVYPDFEDFNDNLKLDGRVSLLTPVSRNVSLRTGLRVNYQEDVLPGVRKMDTVITTGMNYKF
jgi:putative salt-induced outer membrane protein